MHARVAVGGREVAVDLAAPLELAVELDFAGAQPRHFGAPRASSRPFETPGFGFKGSVERGSSCNCEVITLIPHCNGTHTECVGHLTRERLDAWRVTPATLLPALLLSVSPQAAGDEGSDPAPQATDQLIRRRALEAAWPAQTPFVPCALIVRTLPNDAAKRTRDYTGQNPPYLSQQAAGWLVSRGILHLVVDVPSIDRAHDAGRLTAHRIFFGLPPGSVQLAAATRANATITELAFVPDAVGDGCYLLQLQVPALDGDAVPCRPLLYALTASV
ncbi:MAG TPA: cyclase family protein [Steroidobacteraceae bacterium]|nr:cyclase family protein [Steroidobacteraceae bacterium]